MSQTLFQVQTLSINARIEQVLCHSVKMMWRDCNPKGSDRPLLTFKAPLESLWRLAMDRSKLVAIITGAIALLLSIAYLIIVQLLDFRGEMLPAPVDVSLLRAIILG